MTRHLAGLIGGGAVPAYAWAGYGQTGDNVIIKGVGGG